MLPQLTNQKNLNDELTLFAYNLKNLIAAQPDVAKRKSHQDNGAVIAINASWGSGKSFFVDWFIENHLKQNEIELTRYQHPPTTLGQIRSTEIHPLEKKLKVLPITYNAWEDDDMNPFLGLVGQLCNYPNGIDQQAKSNFEKFKIAANGISSILGGLFSSVIDTNKIKDGIKELEGTDEKIFDKQIKTYLQLKKNKESFKKALSNLEGTETIKLIFIDELDRCAPNFAVRFLETVKHYFNAENTVFVVLIDKTILAQNIQHFYGQNIDAERYLSRFFDFELDLPLSKSFYEKLVKQNLGDERFSNLLLLFIGFLKLSAREINKVCFQLQHLRSITSIDRPEIAILLTLKIADSQKFNQLIALVENGKYISGDPISPIVADFKIFLSIFGLDDKWSDIIGDEHIKMSFCKLFILLIYKKHHLNELNKPIITSNIALDKFIKTECVENSVIDQEVFYLEQIIKLLRSFSHDLHHVASLK